MKIINMYAKHMLLILGFVVTLTVGKESPGRCRNLIFSNVQDTTKLAGKWYPSYVGKSANLTHCNSTDIKAMPNGDIKFSNDLVTVDVNLIRVQPGKYALTYPKQLHFAPFAHLNFIDSDATNYAVAVTCMDFKNSHEEQTWVFSRQPKLADNFLKKANEALAKANVKEELIKNLHCYK